MSVVADSYRRNLVFVVFFFSSRRRHTRFDCDWSSDVCSSDLFFTAPASALRSPGGESACAAVGCRGLRRARGGQPVDRKSTRLNSSHSQISYAVFCLKKKKHDPPTTSSTDIRL